jgi:hypothetical protein
MQKAEADCTTLGAPFCSYEGREQYGWHYGICYQRMFGRQWMLMPSSKWVRILPVSQKDRDEGSGYALQIRIPTKLLAMSSPVFKAMLDGRFAKGQLPFSKENPPSVVLPEDDPDAVLNYCKIIHHAQDAQFPISFGALCNLAVLGGKYACNQALSGWFRAQLSECFTPEGVVLTNSALAKGGLTLSGVIGLSYLFGDARIFYRATLRFLRCSLKCYLERSRQIPNGLHFSKCLIIVSDSNGLRKF